MQNHQRLKQQLERQAQRMIKAEKERSTLAAQTIFMGTLGLLLVLPVVGGVFLGHWIDSQLEGYSMRWTLSLLLLGVVVGGINVYLFIREH